MRYFIAYISFFIFLVEGYGQLTENMIKANFVINIAKFVEWENEDTFERFTIGILGRNEVFTEFDKKARLTQIKGKRIEVRQFKKIADLEKVHILYVEDRNNPSLKKILEMAIRDQMLLFSDSCENRNHTMVNLLNLNMPGNQFQVNRDNIENAQLKVSPKLLYHGGSQEDLRELYQASEQRLSKVKVELEQVNQALQEQEDELELRKQEVLNLSKEIDSQKSYLESMIAEVEAKEDSLTLKIALLNAQQQKIIEQRVDIEQQNEQLLSQTQQIEAGKKFLKQQKEEIEDHKKRIELQQREIQQQSLSIDQQNREIREQTDTIEKQQFILYFFIAIFGLIAAMIFFILRAYHIKKQANKKLEEKNVAISRQKEEIQGQQKQLKIINRKIERQNENIKNSIHYALTIQKALLPAKEELNKHFDSFTIYRPRDIVSGDFYWMNKVYTGKQVKLFLAVADCTGHGVPGAFLSMIGIKLLNSIVNERNQDDPKEILEMLHHDVKKALSQEREVSDDGMDVCLCCLEKMNKNKYKISFAGAKRPLYYSDNSEVKVLNGNRKTVGGRFYDKQIFTTKKIVLESGTRIYLTTDGMIDQNAPNRQKFGSKKLVTLLRDSLHLSLDKQKEFLESALDAFQQSERQRDDITLMAIKL